jgi:Lon protease-like protein
VFDADEVDYSQPVALFPLGAATLLPHALQPLHVFEPRYRQMVEDALGDATPADLAHAAPIAMATIAARGDDDGPLDAPPLRPVVCVGRIVQHRRLPDGRHEIVLHGVARARILAMHEPEGQRMYRMAELVPMERPGGPRPAMRQARAAIEGLLSRPRLSRIEVTRHVLDWLARPGLPAHAAIEVAGFALVRDSEQRYRLLAERDPIRRAEIVRDAIAELDRLVALCERQRSDEWPRGESWN